MANRKTQKKRSKRVAAAGRLGVCMVRQQGTVVAVAGLSGPLATALQRALTRAGGRSVAWLSGFAYAFKDEAQAALLFDEAFRRAVVVLPDELPELQAAFSDVPLGALL